MLIRYLTALKFPVATAFVLLSAACSSCPSSGGGGGVTIPQSDSTAPSLSFGAGQPGGQNVSVSAGGSAQAMTLVSKSGPLNLLATAKDPESGIQTVEIWVNKKVTNCNAANICTTTGPGLLGKPTYESASAKKNPGDQTPDSSILAEALDLSTEIPQGGVAAGASRVVTLEMYAVAVNHLGGKTQTPQISATWKEP